MSTRISTLILATVWCFLCVGCGKPAPSDLPKLEKCTIFVKMNGAPLVGAMVNLSAENPSKWFSSGLTNEAGTAVMLTQAEYPGAPTGKYVVTVMKEETGAADPNNPEAGAATILVIDPKFSNQDSSPLRCEVKAGENNFEFEVEAPKK